MSSQVPKYLNTWLKIVSAVVKPDGRYLRGMNLKDIEKQSRITMIMGLPWETGRSVRKSMARLIRHGEHNQFASRQCSGNLGFGTDGT